ncbi:MAG TPA: hypothetical protein VK726_21680 [Acetobacteraceae bacterium]|nr:hypothetical protein [Acetobacteraceae bacterium]
MTAGRRLGPTGYDTGRATLGVVAWILVLLAGYWLATDWHSLPALVHELLPSFR